MSPTGIGIKPDVLPALFDRFRQADSSTTRRYGGLGLGLAIVRQLTELHGGTVSARSDGEGKGATFIVSLPVALPVARAAHPASSHASGHPDGGYHRDLPVEGVRVLVVEDENDTRELLDRILSEAGCKVVAVASANAALDALRAQRPDVLLSDIGLPDEDGYSLIRKIRCLPGEAGAIPAIAVTAFARFEDRTRALHAGFQSHLSKPVRPAELLASVATFARAIRSRDGAAAAPLPRRRAHDVAAAPGRAFSWIQSSSWRLVTATFELSHYGWTRFVDQEIPMMSNPTKIVRFVTFAAFTSLAVLSWAAASPAHAASKDEDAVKARVAEFIGLFNKGDAKAVSAFWTEDGSLVNPVGQKGTGPAGVEKVISGDLATILKGAKMEMQVTQFRPVGKDAAWVELEHTVTGAKRPGRQGDADDDLSRSPSDGEEGKELDDRRGAPVRVPPDAFRAGQEVILASPRPARARAGLGDGRSSAAGRM